MTGDLHRGEASTSDLTLAGSELAELRLIVEGTAGKAGEDFLHTLVSHLAKALQTRFAFVAEIAGKQRVRTLAFWDTDHVASNDEWDLPGTPCEDVIAGNLCFHPIGVAREFPDDKPLQDLGIESYLGVPLRDAQGVVLGHMAVFDRLPMPSAPRKLHIFQIFAGRAAAELERLRAERLLRESEQRFRDLYDEAPIAYVQEGLDSKFINANRAAMRILGITPEQVPETVGMSFIPDTPEAQRRVKDAFESIGRGTDTGGVMLELRRKDNGQPIWIQWWSKPDPSGQFTRTMFIDITERVLMEQAKAKLEEQNRYLQEEIKSVHNFEEIVGRSTGLLKALESVIQVAPTDASVMVTGETGTGKELIARAIHSNSPRKDKPLIKINCAALPSGLVESELFGHERGAFSGAINKRIGRFEIANGGTIFLDEIGEMPLDVQAKVLRVIQEREFERVGGNATIRVDVRIIAATNRDLHQCIREGTFRQDLFYRLNVFPLHLPPLRERQEDISLLVHFMVSKYAARVGKRIEQIAPDTLARLTAYPWPGNIRELENVVERAVILNAGTTLRIDPALLDAHGGGAAAAPVIAPATATLEEVEVSHIRSVLQQTNWVIEGPNGAAKILNLHPNTLRSRLKKLGLTRGSA